jgi:hypothetical protein
MHTDLECPTHGATMKRCLAQDQLWRELSDVDEWEAEFAARCKAIKLILIESHDAYVRGEALDSLDEPDHRAG